MALFKILKGNKALLPTTYTEGWMYVTEDTADMYIDMAGEKKQLNANQANYLRDLNNTLLDIGSVNKPVYFLNGVPVECGTVSNAAKASQFDQPQTITLDGDVTGSSTSSAGWTIETVLINTGVTANNYGPSADASPINGGTFKVPYITVDAKGRITAASTKTITLPSYSLSSFGITATAAELNKLDGVTATTAELNIVDGLTATTTELNYCDGVTSNIQTQLNGKLSTTETAANSRRLSNTSAIGSSDVPVYFNASGVPVACGTLSVNTTGNAATATTATSATNATKIYSSASTEKAYILGTQGTSSSNKDTYFNTNVYTSGSVLYGAAWNDYAEYRETKEKIQAGHVVVETGNGDLKLSSKRLEPGANIVSDTFGFAIGQTEICGTPIAVCGRVLAYPYEDISEFTPGDPVCAGPNGTISLMSRIEVQEYPDRMIGTVSEIPTYEYWKDGSIKVDGRIWIKVL